MLVLRPLKPLAFTSAPSRDDVVERAHRLDPGQFADAVGMARPVGAAMRPVDLQPVADRPAEHLVDRNAQRLGLDVDQRVLDRGDRLRVDAAGRLPCRGVEIGACGARPAAGPARSAARRAFRMTRSSPCAPYPSMNSDQPTMPSSVVILRNELTRQPASQCRSSILVIFIAATP